MSCQKVLIALAWEVRASAPAELWAGLELNLTPCLLSPSVSHPPGPVTFHPDFSSPWSLSHPMCLSPSDVSPCRRLSVLHYLSLQPCSSLSPGVGSFLPTPAPKSSGEIGGSWSAGISKSLLFHPQNTNAGSRPSPAPVEASGRLSHQFLQAWGWSWLEGWAAAGLGSHGKACACVCLCVLSLR